MCNSLEALHAACRAGQGIAWLPAFLVQDDLQAGRLTTVLAAYEERDAGGEIYVLRPRTAFLPRRVRLLVDFLVDHFKETQG